MHELFKIIGAFGFALLAFIYPVLLNIRAGNSEPKYSLCATCALAVFAISTYFIFG